jgi:outer membrane protein TolC
VTQKLSGTLNGEQASVAAARAQLATAKAQVDSTRAEVAKLIEGGGARVVR